VNAVSVLGFSLRKRAVAGDAVSCESLVSVLPHIPMVVGLRFGVHPRAQVEDRETENSTPNTTIFESDAGGLARVLDQGGMAIRL
jgi:hypothetical protein